MAGTKFNACSWIVQYMTLSMTWLLMHELYYLLILGNSWISHDRSFTMWIHPGSTIVWLDSYNFFINFLFMNLHSFRVYFVHESYIVMPLINPWIGWDSWGKGGWRFTALLINWIICIFLVSGGPCNHVLISYIKILNAHI